MQWGHQPTCGCVICITLKRVHGLIAENSQFGGFIHWFGNELRGLEARIRDEAQRFEAGQPSFFGPPPSFLPGAATPGGLHLPVQPRGVGFPAQPAKPARESAGAVSQPKDKPAEPAAPHCTPKSGPPNPPSGSEGKGVVKVEPAEESKEPVAEVQDLGEEHTRKPKRSRSRRRRREEEDPVERETRRRDRKEKEKRKRSPSEVEDKGVDRTPRKEKKSRERADQEEQPRESRSSGASRPHPPDYPPPRGKGSHKGGRGPGWIGHIPRSNHPRWSHHVPNKGVTKRVKQEYFNKRR